MSNLMFTGALLLALGAPLVFAAETAPFTAVVTSQPFPGATESQWHGYRRLNFSFMGHGAWITFPKTAAPGNPWMWRARFPGYHDEIDLELLKRGYHTVHVDTGNLYGASKAMEVWDALYGKVTAIYGLNPRVVLYGVSRGGLFVYGFAARWPERVATIYGDTPVMDFTSWPEGKGGTGTRSADDWERLKKVYGFASDAEAETYGGIPLNAAERLAKYRIPIWHTIGPEDRIVPSKHNTERFAQRFRAAGGEMAIHSNKGPYALQGHHFPLDAVGPTVRFIEANTPLPDLPANVMATWSRDAAALRPALDRIAGLKRARVLYLGGSITQNPGWQALVSESLRRRFPGVELECVNVGIASLGSLSHAFRWREHFGGPADLVFFEAAVNDLHNGQTAEETERAYEGVIRGILSENPQAGIVCLHFAEPRHTSDYAEGKTPAVIARQARIAAHYGVPQINLAKEVADRLAARQFDWERDFRDLHPSPFGQRLYYNAVRRLLNAASLAPASPLPAFPAPLRADCWDKGTFILGAKAKACNGAEAIATWMPNPPCETRRFFVNCPLLRAKGNGASFAFDFTGKTLGAYVVSGPASAVLEWSVDGGAWQCRDTRTPWSGHIYMPWPYLLTTTLHEGAHTVRFRVKAKDERDTILLYGLMVNP